MTAPQPYANQKKPEPELSSPGESVGTHRRLVRAVPGGPLLVEGPVRIETPDGAVVDSDRFMVAICACRRSKTYPLCDTSHRQRRRS